MERKMNQLNTYLAMDGSFFVDHVFLAQNMGCTESCTSHIGMSCLNTGSCRGNLTKISLKY